MYLFTAGYEGILPEAFIKKLKENHIERIIDVRENAVSRKKQFSKSNLKEWMESNGIEYEHYRLLGSPKEIRNVYKETNNFVEFYENYLEYISTKEELLRVVEEKVVEKTSCLLCFEKDAKACHRSIIAMKLVHFNNSLKVIDL